jgi:transposase
VDKVFKTVGARGDFAAMEACRMRAVDYFESGGLSKAEIARRVGVVHQTVSDWYQLWETGGRDALRAAGRAGRLPKLAAEQLERIEAELLNGAGAHGYPNDLWTLRRVAEVIDRLTGVAYHPHHVWRILRQKLGWSSQRPARRAVERDEEAIETWVKDRWPQIKKRPASGRVDRVRGRVGLLDAAVGACHLGPQRQDPGVAAPLQLEADLHSRRLGV